MTTEEYGQDSRDHEGRGDLQEHAMKELKPIQ